MKMLKDNLLVKPLTKEQLGKIVMPDSVEDEWRRGEVIQVGPCISEVPINTTQTEPAIKVGDIIIFPPYFYGRPYPTVGSEGYMIVQESSVWAIEN